MLLKWINSSSDCVVLEYRGRDESLLKQIRCYLSTRGVNVPMKLALRGHAALLALTGTNKHGASKPNTSSSLWTRLQWCQLWQGQPTERRVGFVFKAPMHLRGDIILLGASIRAANRRRTNFASKFGASGGDSLQTRSSNAVLILRITPRWEEHCQDLHQCKCLTSNYTSSHLNPLSGF